MRWVASILDRAALEPERSPGSSHSDVLREGEEKGKRGRAPTAFTVMAGAWRWLVQLVTCPPPPRCWLGTELKHPRASLPAGARSGPSPALEALGAACRGNHGLGLRTCLPRNCGLASTAPRSGARRGSHPSQGPASATCSPRQPSPSTLAATFREGTTGSRPAPPLGLSSCKGYLACDGCCLRSHTWRSPCSGPLVCTLFAPGGGRGRGRDKE